MKKMTFALTALVGLVLLPLPALAHTDFSFNVWAPGYVEPAPPAVVYQPYAAPDYYNGYGPTYYNGYGPTYYYGDNWRARAWREHEWREHEWREHHWRD